MQRHSLNGRYSGRSKGRSSEDQPEGGLLARSNALFAFGRKAMNVESKMAHAMEETMEKVGERLGDRFEVIGDLANLSA